MIRNIAFVFIFLGLLNLHSCVVAKPNGYVTKSIRDFGAKGNGINNDHDAFVKASKFINNRNGNVILKIPSGSYIVGKQVRGTQPNAAYLGGINLISLKDCHNVKIEGSKNTKIQYANNLKFGAFNPRTGKKHNSGKPFYDKSYIAQLGCAIQIINSTNVEISNIEMNGNSKNLIIGGRWGGTGHQLQHYGIHIIFSKDLLINNCNVHHFALDGMSITNTGKQDDHIKIKSSNFEYNGRQGLSWVGGRGLLVQNSSFSHTGRAGISSSPGGGVDFEAENGRSISKGTFIDCEFINNTGSGIVANSGKSRDVSFTRCTFWGTDNWSAWVQKPKYTFTDCNFYGSFVHGYITNLKLEATKFYNCRFEDKPYKGKRPYGRYLLEFDGGKMMIFEDCSFIANECKIMWFNGKATKENEKAIIKNCSITVKNNKWPQRSFFAVMRRMNMESINFNYFFPKSKKYHFLQDYSTKKSINIKYEKQ